MLIKTGIFGSDKSLGQKSRHRRIGDDGSIPAADAGDNIPVGIENT